VGVGTPSNTSADGRVAAVCKRCVARKKRRSLSSITNSRSMARTRRPTGKAASTCWAILDAVTEEAEEKEEKEKEKEEEKEEEEMEDKEDKKKVVQERDTREFKRTSRKRKVRMRACVTRASPC
jgi:hypothetical protein